VQRLILKPQLKSGEFLLLVCKTEKEQKGEMVLCEEKMAKSILR